MVRASVGSVAVLLSYALLFLPEPWLRALLDEDGALETLSAVALLVASLASFRAGFRSDGLRRLGLLACGAALFICMGEEISWGQRIFGVATPEPVAAVNRQGELNVHNLPLFHEGLLDAGRLFNLAALVLLVVLPIAARFSAKARKITERVLPLSPLTLVFPMIANAVGSKLAVFLFSTSFSFPAGLPVAHYAIEIRETVTAVLLACMAAHFATEAQAQTTRAQLVGPKIGC